MTEQTRAVIASLVQCDSSMTNEEREAAEALLKGYNRPDDEVIPIPEVAKMFHKHPKTIHYWCRHGTLRKVTVGKQSRASGILKSSVDALLKGGADAGKAVANG